MAEKQTIDAMWDDSPVDVSTEVNFIWSIANKLRGTYQSDKYKDVIIPMVIIRRFECALAPTKQKVVDQFKANPAYPAKAMYRVSGYQFYNTSEFDLAELVNDADHLAANFKSYIQGFSANIQDIIKSLDFDKQIDKMDKNNRLLSVVKAFSELDLNPVTIDNVKMGYIFEDLIRRFSENAEAGDHYTGRDIIKLMVNILLAEGCDDIFDDGKVITVLDQACGTGGMLSTSYNFIKRYNPSADVRLFGQEINPESYAICLAEMMIKGQNAENICYQDTMKADRFKGTKMRFVIENPPFGTPWGGKDAAEGVEQAVNDEYTKGFDGRWGAGLPGSGDMQMLFLQSAIDKMDDNFGRAAIIENGSPLFSGGTASGESQIRRWMLENDLIEAIIALPTDLFYNTGIATYIWVLSKNKRRERNGKIQLIDASGFYNKLRKALGDKKNEISPENRSEITKLYADFAENEYCNSIAWLAHRLTSLHDANNKIIFDNVVIVTDRVVVDRQLQKAIMGMEHKAGLIRVMDDKCVSADLAIALNGNTKIIATTIQKFPYIVDSVANLKNKRFAVIIDEAHSSTAGKDMAAITMTLGSGEDTEADVEDMISSEIKRNGKQANVSMFAFTATPKPTTIQLFGHQNTKGQKEAFHVYSMKQAIEEGFILDVLQNYTEYSTFYQINKEIEDDPRCKTNDAKRQIARFIELHDTNIAQRVEVIVEHFRTTVMQELGGQAKAMVITASRQSAVKYRQAFEDYIAKKGYEGIHALVAFSGKVKLPDDEQEYTESSLNGFPEDRLTKEFDTDKYQVLLVANKYQTGFDQPKLCAMYVLKKLKGVNAVQTLSRLNRICAPYDKKTFVLDFVNSYEDIKSAFAPYYTTTLLANSVTPSAVYDLEAKIDAYGILDPADIEAANDILYADKVNGKQKQRLTFFLQKSKKLIEHYEYNTQRQCVADMRSFVRFYEFLLQVSSFEDTDLHKKYNFVSYLLAYINIKHPGGGFNLDGKIKATNFVQKKGEEHKSADLVADPVMKLPTAEHFGLTEDKEKRLSEIIDEINSRTGKNYDNDLVVRAMLQIRDILMKSEKLKTSARNNTQQDFEFSYFDDIDDALIEGLSQNQDFFSMLLSNDEMKRQVLGIFSDEIYKSLRNAK